jgi:glutamine synthetase
LRCADPSCNPYLAVAVALAAGLDGVRAGMEPPAPAVLEVSRAAAGDELVETLPASLGEAIHELEWDPVVRSALGAPVYERLLAAKEQEWQAYREQVSAWELDRYFLSA